MGEGSSRDACSCRARRRSPSRPLCPWFLSHGGVPWIPVASLHLTAVSVNDPLAEGGAAEYLEQLPPWSPCTP